MAAPLTLVAVIDRASDLPLAMPDGGSLAVEFTATAPLTYGSGAGASAGAGSVSGVGMGIVGAAGSSDGAASVAGVGEAVSYVITLTNLNSGEARNGDVIGVSISPALGGGETVSYQWTDNDTPIGGATSSTFTVNIGTNMTDGQALRCEVTIDGETYPSNGAPARYAPVAETGLLGDQSFTENTGVQTYDASVGFTLNGNTVTYSVNSVPGVSINSSTGVVSFDTDAMAVQADTAILVITTDAYSRVESSGFSLAITAAAAAPVISLPAFTDADDIGTVSTDTPNNGNFHIAVVGRGDAAPAPDGAGGWIGVLLEELTVAVGADGADIEINTTSATGDGPRDFYLYQRTTGGADSNVVSQEFTADNTAPTLSSVSTTPGNTTAALDWSTNEANGDAYWVLTTSATVPSVANIIAGNDHTGSAATDSGTAAVSATGAQTQISSTGLSNGTTYYYHLVHRDDHRNDSSVSTTSVTPAAAGTPIVGWTAAVGANPSTGPALDLTSLDAAGSALGTGDGGALQEGDVVFIWSSTCSNTARTNNVTGYTFLPGDDVLHGQDLSFRAMYKVMGPTPDTTAQAAYNGDSNAAHILIGVAVRGLDTASVVDGTATEAEAPSASSVVNPPSATPSTTGAKLLVFGSSTDSDSHDISVNADITLIGKVSNLGTGRFVIGAVGIKDDWTSGAFDPGVWTSDNTDSGDECWGAVTVPIKPA